MNNYYHDTITNLQQDPKKCWRFLNETLGRNVKPKTNLKDTNGNIISDNADKCERFNQYFLQIPKIMMQQIHSSSVDSCNGLRTLRSCNNTFRLTSTTTDEILEIISKLSTNKSPGHDALSPKVFIECSQEISPYLFKIFNSIIQTSEYPNILKISSIIPIPKEINASSEDKYRPIALLPIIDKIFEKIIHQQLVTYLEKNKLVYDHQYGFRNGTGTEDAVVNVVNYICGELDNGFNGVAGLFFDLSKAFDLVDHKIMVQKLQYYGITDRELALFKSYLINRYQYVAINSHRSRLGLVEHGVPQGSVLGPLLFTSYINDIVNLGLNVYMIFLYFIRTNMKLH